MSITLGTGAAIAGIISSIVGAAGATGINHLERRTDREEAQKNRDYNANQAQIQRDWETQMSNTAYQRGVADMKAAGINPAMAYANGASGASTPSGASASSNSANSGHTNLGSTLNGAASIINALNNDKEHGNNINLGQAIKMIGNVARIFK